MFKAQQSPLSYIYVTLDYPYLRAPMQDNALCSDCHTQTTHSGFANHSGGVNYDRKDCAACHSHSNGFER